ncbi:MAG TPA: ergothioneine biosynthesis protein EgtB [Acidimicrobiales bacterium]|nr:ergothioneine biosynthesis protein EgtB [Acidimicrobiales bacterium]
MRGPATSSRAQLAAQLEQARRASLCLVEPLPERLLTGQHSPLMSPLVWDLAHVANYEDQWLLRALGLPGVAPQLDQVYDAFRHPRPTRSRLPLLGPGQARRYMDEVRGRALEALEGQDLEGGGPLVQGGFVYAMVAQHEHQHDETMLASLQLSGDPAGRPPAAPPPTGRPVRPAEVLVEAGPFVMGTDSDPFAYDNERPAHQVELGAFWIDTAPVTNAAYAAFVEDGGYDQPRWWSPAGWEWRLASGARHPQFWHREGPGSWSLERFGARSELAGDEPVQHVCFHEAEAYAAWAGKRLPSEAEWEKAASWSPSGAKRRLPWGDQPWELGGQQRANLGQAHLGPAPVGAYPGGASAYGAQQMLGDVWEWTASDFLAYPGFCAFPYREYSEVFFASSYKVLRGGSWATHPLVARCTFRNWDFPVRRHIFAGFRCARDA